MYNRGVDKGAVALTGCAMGAVVLALFIAGAASYVLAWKAAEYLHQPGWLGVLALFIVMSLIGAIGRIGSK